MDPESATFSDKPIQALLSVAESQLIQPEARNNMLSISQSCSEDALRLCMQNIGPETGTRREIKFSCHQYHHHQRINMVKLHIKNI